MKLAFWLCLATITACCPTLPLLKDLNPTAATRVPVKTDVCVLIDAHNPVSKMAVLATIDFASDFWKTYFFRSFEITHYASYSGDMSGLPRDRVTEYRTYCPPGSLMFFFTEAERSKRRFKNDVAIHGNTTVEVEEDLEVTGGANFDAPEKIDDGLGGALPAASAVIFYHAGRQYRTKVCERNIPKLFLTALHEIGHIYGALHVEDIDSFMHEYGPSYCALLTKETYEQIELGRYKDIE